MSHISYSELKTWVECAWKHKLNYIERISPFKGNEYTAFGTALHTVCENLVLEKEVNLKTLFQEEFLNNLTILKKGDPELQFKADLISQMRVQGDQIIEHILPALKQHFGNFKLIEVEEKLFEDIEEKDYNFKGFIDLVIQTKDEKYHIIDWKTCSWGWDSRKKSDKMITYQLTLYKHFWCIKHNVDPISVQTHFALLKRTAKNNLVEIFKVSSGAKKTENALKLLNKAIYNIKRKSHIKNKLSCHGRYGTCEFYKTEHCP
jgi:hypothetical protein